MNLLILGLVVFLGVHSIAIVAPGWRNAMAERLGLGAWKGLYALVSLVGFAMIVHGFAEARLAPQVVWVPPAGLRHVALLLMLPVFPLLVAAYLPGRIKATVKHPMLTAVKCWALAHLLANGNAAHLLLFGGFLAWAVADRMSIKRRAAAVAPTGGPLRNDLIAVVVGLALYVGFLLHGHLALIGVSPLPAHT